MSSSKPNVFEVLLNCVIVRLLLFTASKCCLW